jgi:tetratricopeptide (TPR) repeat protein
VLQAQPHAAIVHAPLAAAYRRLGQLDKARQQAAAYGAGEVELVDVLMSQLQAANAGNTRRYGAAALAYNRGDYAAAAAEIRQALAVDPRDVRSWMLLGRSQERLGDAAGAEQSYRRAVEVDPDHPRARLSLGTLLAQRGARREAIEQLAAAVRLRPDLPDARFNLAKALAEDGRLAEALAQCDALLQMTPQDRDAQALREQLRTRLGPGRSGG